MSLKEGRQKYYQERLKRMTDQQREAERKRRNENARKWRLNNADHYREYQRRWKAEHPEQVRASQEKFFEKRSQDT